PATTREQAALQQRVSRLRRSRLEPSDGLGGLFKRDSMHLGREGDDEHWNCRAAANSARQSGRRSQTVESTSKIIGEDEPAAASDRTQRGSGSRSVTGRHATPRSYPPSFREAPGHAGPHGAGADRAPPARRLYRCRRRAGAGALCCAAGRAGEQGQGEVSVSSVSGAVKDGMLRLVPNLRAFAVSLCGNIERADDLVQETLLKAWNNIDDFQEGTNLRAWLFTILRNTYFSDCRRRRREVEDRDGIKAADLSVHPEQPGHLDMQDFRRALDALPPDQREALVLVGAAGFSYEEAAEISR